MLRSSRGLCNVCIFSEPVILLACGSFNPITTMHLRMMELARDSVERTWSVPQIASNSSMRDMTVSSGLPSTTCPNPSNLSEHHGLYCPVYALPRRQFVIGGILSPVSDGYAKSDLVPSTVRVELARLACQFHSDWLVVDNWEASQPMWTRTRIVVDRLQSIIDKVCRKLNGMENDVRDSIQVPPKSPSRPISMDHVDANYSEVPCLATESWLMDCLLQAAHPSSEFGHSVECQCYYGGEKSQTVICNTQNLCSSSASYTSFESPSCKSVKMCYPRPRVKLVCGADVLQSFGIPNLWSEEDMEVLVRDYGFVCISRPGTEVAKFIFNSGLLSKYESNIQMVSEWCDNNLSSTLVRRSLRLGQSIRYLVPDAALEKIYELGLYGARRPQRFILQSDQSYGRAPTARPLSPTRVKGSESDRQLTNSAITTENIVPSF
ncbi:Nicotinamide mononucleotide adenylyltransferase [Paragonimus heterotremus]|uniref:Nicotinamide mononucleotide adenylyltransferase n=1 Tax=Paragonimus heterotremus TaxID=100268 RepID=A0A8J4TIV1_9TREM|nr:Nicotinamide mononucleotide adenylyltransferase [Paragonimus heterotremus]